jgi:SsrA-binding protein
MKIIETNKKALFNFELVEHYEAGMMLLGWEVKSIRAGHVSLKESYVLVKEGRAFLIGAHVSKWPGAQVPAGGETRTRELLLRDPELTKLYQGIKEKGFTITPLNIHLSGRRIKLEIALARGKKLYDKRAKLKAEDSERELSRDLKHLGLPG